MKLYNTKTRKLEEFNSIEKDIVKIYSCGPTVYDSIHIGNLRAFTFADILKKVLQFKGYKVLHVMNITDFGHLVGDGDDGEDKMSVGLKRENLPRNLEGMKTLAEKYTKIFLEDIQEINIALPDFLPKASDYINEYIEIIKLLDQKGFVYKTSDGLYFDTEKDKNYGKMALLDRQESLQSRLQENTEKKNSRDFALWKFAEEKQNTEIIGFESSFGFGFPGWHIECSGMSKKFLGKTFDIHTGGVDHIAVHHTNEIAQSENAHDCTYANFFCHCEFLNVNNEKMAKSKNNFTTLKDIKENTDPLAFRYFLLQSHYRQNINFNFESLKASDTALSRLKKHLANLKTERKDEEKKVSEKYLNIFKESIFDDLNTSKALANLWEMLKDENISNTEKYFTALEMDKVFSLSLDEELKEETFSQEIQDLISEREIYRKEKNFAKADEIREKLKSLGYIMQDR
jgi:cysteinyl-tRNA synthetase